MLLKSLAAMILLKAMWLHWLGVFLGLSSALMVIALDKEDDSKWKTALLILGGISLLPGLAYVLIPVLAKVADIEASRSNLALLAWLASTGMGVAGGLWFLRHGVHKLEGVFAKFKKKSSLERNRRTDVREIDAFLPAAIGSFDPCKYFDEASGMFVGLDENKEPVYIPYEDWKLSHVLLSGRTRSGKGVAAQSLLSQAIQRGEFVIVLDPKGDAWMPYIFKKISDECGQPYVLVDFRKNLNDGTALWAQINLFEGCDEETIESMLIGAFSLAEKGEAADFYRLSDRAAARAVARYVIEERKALGRSPTPIEICEHFAPVWDDSDNREAPKGFAAAMRELAAVPAVNRTTGGVDILALERTGGCLYTIGDMGNTSLVKIQRMLLLRLMMLAKKRDYINADPRQITVFADEFKVHISKPFMTSLGAAAGWGLHCILAFQSLQDLADCPADLDKDAVRGGVMENCAIQLSYRIKDPETAEWLAASTGQILVDDESRRIKTNIALSETFESERSVRLAERYFVDMNMMMNMPKGCGVLVGATKLPSFCYTSPIKVVRDPAAVTPTVAKGTAQQAKAKTLADAADELEIIEE